MKHLKLKALIPIGIFLVVYPLSGWLIEDFNEMSIIISFLPAALAAIWMAPGQNTKEKVEQFTKGMGHSGIMMMCLIFLMAGAFANVAREMGAVDATAAIGLYYLPKEILLAGLFIIACFISLAVGTSVGTVVALTPVAMTLADTIDFNSAIAVGALFGVAVFGDNL